MSSSTNKVTVTQNTVGVLISQATHSVMVEPSMLNVVVDETDFQVVVTTTGPQGPPGPPGGDSFYYLHTQSAPSTTWTVNHGLGAEPNITAIIGDAAVICHATYPDLNTVILTFNTPTSGRAVCS